jgi:hypothetical protein
MQFDREIIFLSERNPRDPLCRFYFDTLATQLASGGEIVKSIAPTEDLAALLDPSKKSIINFFYKDADSIDAIKRLNTKKISSICFCSDVESYSNYEQAFEVADIFVCPSPMHQQILQYVFDLPIYVLREALDPILKNIAVRKSSNEGINIVWFGFSESYRRSMVSLELVIIDALQNNWINTFTIISSDSIRGSLPREFKFIEFEVDKFEEQLQAFEFTILSHVPLDLHLNTLIKSPNKACSAIVSGIIPICSDTPNYRLLMDELQLGSYIFNSPSALLTILKELSGRITRDDLDSKWRYANELVHKAYSAESQCDEYLRILSKLASQNNGTRIKNSVRLYAYPDADLKLRFYLRQQLSKLKRKFRILKL